MGTTGLGTVLYAGLPGTEVHVACWTFSKNCQPVTRDLALASMARDDLPASSTAAAMRGKVGSEFET